MTSQLLSGFAVLSAATDTRIHERIHGVKALNKKNERIHGYTDTRSFLVNKTFQRIHGYKQKLQVSFFSCGYTGSNSGYTDTRYGYTDTRIQGTDTRYGYTDTRIQGTDTRIHGYMVRIHGYKVIYGYTDTREFDISAPDRMTKNLADRLFGAVKR